MNENALLKRCTGLCGRLLPSTSEYFYYSNYVTKSLRGKCKECKDKEKAASRSEKQIGNSPDRCGSCGTDKGNILGDINTATHERYGYLCARCYKVVRDFHGDTKRMRNVINYIDRTRKHPI